MFKSITPNLMVENVAMTVEFYKENLNFNLLNSVDDKNGSLNFAIVERDGLLLMFQEKNNFGNEYAVLKTQKVQPSISLYIQTNNLMEIYQSLLSSNLVYTKMHKTFYGTNEFAITDNNGYILTFTENE